MFTPGRFQTRYAKLVALFVGSAITLLVVLAARDTSMEAQVTALRVNSIKNQYVDRCGTKSSRMTRRTALACVRGFNKTLKSAAPTK